MMMNKETFTKAFYSEYHGHTVPHLEVVYSAIHNRIARSTKDTSTASHTQSPCIIYLAGDSSLDNKFWANSGKLYKPPAVGLENVLSHCVPDVGYFINKKAECGNSGAQRFYACINAAVEESTLRERNRGKSLLPQDNFIRDHISSNDVLVVSVGGNDIVLQPTVSTIVSVLWLSKCSTTYNLVNNHAWGYEHMMKIFKDDVSAYISALVSKTKPKRVVVCMIYFPDNTTCHCWADRSLSLMGYDVSPQRVHAMIRNVYKHATCQVSVDGTECVPLALFDIMNGDESEDYVARVEPSAVGGKKMAEVIFKVAISDT